MNTMTGRSFRLGAAIAAALLATIEFSLAQTTMRVDERVMVVVGAQRLQTLGLVIEGRTYVPLAELANAFSTKASYDKQMGLVTVEPNPLMDRIAQLEQANEALRTERDQIKSSSKQLTGQLDESKADAAGLRGQNETLAQAKTRLEQQNNHLARLVATARYFNYRTKRVGRNLEMPRESARRDIDYWGIVTCNGEDLFVFLPLGGGGPTDASAIQVAQRTAEVLNDIVTSDRELKPQLFGITTAGTGNLAIAYEDGAGGRPTIICAVDNNYARIAYDWLRANENRIPKEKRLRSVEDTAHLVRDWWLSTLRDHISLITNADMAPGTTTQCKDAGEMFINVIRDRLLKNPLPEGEVRYPPLQISDVVNQFTPEQKLTYYDIHHEEGLLAYLVDIWKPKF